MLLVKRYRNKFVLVGVLWNSSHKLKFCVLCLLRWFLLYIVHRSGTKKSKACSVCLYEVLKSKCRCVFDVTP